MANPSINLLNLNWFCICNFHHLSCYGDLTFKDVSIQLHHMDKVDHGGHGLFFSQKDTCSVCDTRKQQETPRLNNVEQHGPE